MSDESEFGIQLFNLYTRREDMPFIFSGRRRVVRAMLAAMAEAEAKERPILESLVQS
jgi:hypothetical protein